MVQDPSGDDRAAWRSPTLADAIGLADHTRRIHDAEHLSHMPGSGFFEWLLTQPGLDPATDVRVGEVDGTIVADCGAWLHSGDAEARCIIWAEASPGHEHLRPAMIAWARDRATERLAGTETTGRRTIRTAVEEHRVDVHHDLVAAGLTHSRTFAEMARSLADLPPLRQPPDGLQIEPWNDDLLESTVAASNESFADHWGSIPMTPEEFAGFTSESPTFRCDLSFVALAEGRVVSFCMCEVDTDDNDVRDTTDVFVNRVGTIPPHRGRGLASVLILRSLHAAAESGGLDRAALEVDEMSHTNATAVYERLGFETYSRNFHFTKDV